ncbi:MAG: hypothetical protein ACT4OY_08950 [Alphaproteobacteria bacterium]
MISINIHTSGPSGSHHKAFSAESLMSGDNDKSMKKKWGKTGDKPALFQPKEINLYADKQTLEAFIFHDKKIDYDTIERLEYDPDKFTVDVIMKNGAVWDLGVKLQWLIRPYFTKVAEVMVVQTKDGQSIDGRLIPFIHKEKKSV